MKQPYPSHPDLCRALIERIGEHDSETHYTDAVGALLSTAATIAAYCEMEPDAVQAMLGDRVLRARYHLTDEGHPYPAPEPRSFAGNVIPIRRAK